MFSDAYQLSRVYVFVVFLVMEFAMGKVMHGNISKVSMLFSRYFPVFASAPTTFCKI